MSLIATSPVGDAGCASDAAVADDIYNLNGFVSSQMLKGQGYTCLEYVKAHRLGDICLDGEEQRNSWHYLGQARVAMSDSIILYRQLRARRRPWLAHAPSAKH